MQSVDTIVAQLGTTQTEPAPTKLVAGPLSVEFQGGALRYLRYAGQEVIRAISFLARDENWGTHSLDLSDVQIQQRDDRFDVRFTGACGPTGGELRLSASIAGRADGTLEFRAQAALEGDLLTNRTGFVVLHPLDVSGKPVVVETVDGERRDTLFPVQIDPFQPFRDIRALTTRHTDTLSAEVRLEGDTFEMEDQRNWSDASFKTYVRPLALPWPYTLEKGSTLDQAVTVRIDARRPAPADAAEKRSARIVLGAATTQPIPQLGIGVRAEDLDDASRHADALRALNPAYFIAHVDVRHDDVASALPAFARLADASSVPYVLEVVLNGDGGDPAREMALIAAAVRGQTPPIALQVSPAPDLKAVLPGSPWPPCPSFDDVLAAARAAFPGVPLGGGSFAYFTEFNRKRPPFEQIDYATFTTCPLVHAADDRSVMETLATLPFIAGSAAALAGRTPLRVGPSTIAARDNPYGSATLSNEAGPAGRRVCLTDNDPRQRGLFGAAWNLGYFAAFAAGGVGHIALSELTGPRGLFDEARPVPLFHLLASLAAARGATLVETRVEQGSAPLAALAAAPSSTTTTLWVANLCAEPQSVELQTPRATATIARWRADADYTQPPAHRAFDASTLTLDPYETVELRIGA
ncbi:MAG TPA: hypothetical protein VL689_16325 [Paraburkholderia sp.]|jgi:hypothetical protein|nr:hypothetical protein [Paraburkholderia sp.]